MKVKNLNGSSSNYPKPTCKCLTWLEHWKNNRYGVSANYSKLNCRGCKKLLPYSKLKGGHVYKTNNSDKSIYIVPLCDDCNLKREYEFDVDSNDLVSANCSNCINK